jgi:hypothetical protein
MSREKAFRPLPNSSPVTTMPRAPPTRVRSRRRAPGPPRDDGVAPRMSCVTPSRRQMIAAPPSTGRCSHRPAGEQESSVQRF